MRRVVTAECLPCHDCLHTPADQQGSGSEPIGSAKQWCSTCRMKKIGPCNLRQSSVLWRRRLPGIASRHSGTAARRITLVQSLEDVQRRFDTGRRCPPTRALSKQGAVSLQEEVAESQALTQRQWNCGTLESHVVTISIALQISYNDNHGHREETDLRHMPRAQVGQASVHS